MPIKILTALAACLFAAPAVLAQQPAERQPRRIAVPQMSEQAFNIPALGLSLRLPEDAILDMAPPTAGVTGARIWPQNKDDGWHITVYSSITSDRSQNPRTVLDSLIAAFEAQFPTTLQESTSDTPKNTFVKVIRRDNNLVVGPSKMRAARAYLHAPDIATGVARGFTVFQTGTGQFTIFQLHAPQDALSEPRLIYETIITLAGFRDPSEINAERAAPLLAGDALLESLTKEDYDQAASTGSTFFRMYSPQSSAGRGDSEVAWQRVEIKMGQLGDLNPDRPKVEWSQSEREFGYLVAVDARAKVEEMTIDTRGLFFLSRDRTTERWSLRTEVVQGGKVLDHQTQTLVRDDARLTVRTEKPGAQPSTVDYRIPDQGYLSRVEAYLLPKLIAEKEIPGAFAFYNFDPKLNKLTLRRETFSKRQAGGWLQTTRLTEGATTFDTYLDTQGNILQQKLANGVVMEPIERNQLLSLWRDSTLPSR